jgi:hypothetical protein
MSFVTQSELDPFLAGTDPLSVRCPYCARGPLERCAKLVKRSRPDLGVRTKINRAGEFVPWLVKTHTIRTRRALKAARYAASLPKKSEGAPRAAPAAPPQS